jgi:hypothetical protein
MSIDKDFFFVQVAVQSFNGAIQVAVEAALHCSGTCRNVGNISGDPRGTSISGPVGQVPIFNKLRCS